MKSQPTAYVIQQVVASDYGLTPEKLRSASRINYLIIPRYAAILLTHQLTDMSLKQIGRQFGDRHHTTILYAIHKARRVINPKKLERLRADILARSLEEDAA